MSYVTDIYHVTAFMIDCLKSLILSSKLSQSGAVHFPGVLSKEAISREDFLRAVLWSEFYGGRFWEANGLREFCGRKVIVGVQFSGGSSGGSFPEGHLFRWGNVFRGAVFQELEFLGHHFQIC